jgi:formylmethanofuran dehydrogenase subunit B
MISDIHFDFCHGEMQVYHACRIGDKQFSDFLDWQQTFCHL